MMRIEFSLVSPPFFVHVLLSVRFAFTRHDIVASIMAVTAHDPKFPCSLTVYIPFPSNRLAKAALRTLSVDPELSSLVERSFSLVTAVPDSQSAVQHDPFKAALLANAAPAEPIHATTTNDSSDGQLDDPAATILKTEYKATTNRMLRVSVNGFFESLGTVIQVMEELDIDVVHEKGLDSLEGAQGVEQGMTGSTG
ncbi:hypothetical protein AC578_2832 [Pseudocercospora eumusae]|uniref:Pcc1-domain-containing protein n=1 Tax=Pseudocercospora eumusae TaxID=321146 RepID=A0A139H1E0_9PEZI|nr:hypothetical protein AC578_2832 [Pseudocercospora eumusae]KXS96198.1 hypothetical protein AC578_2832 [Pseudocercospora eumusae]